MDFDQYSSSYDEMLSKQQSFFARERGYFHESKIAHLRSIARQEVRNVLDFGCGVGGALPFLRAAFPDAAVHGYDPSDDSLSVARGKYPWANLVNGECLPGQHFDVIYMACVMHHIPPPEWQHSLRQAADLLAPGGTLAIFEHNPWNPVTRWLVRRCPFDADAVLLTRRQLISLFHSCGLSVSRSDYFLVFPESLRALVPLERLMRHLPIGGQYFVAGHPQDRVGD
jgi:SAM-dependent methyltransferase